MRLQYLLFLITVTIAVSCKKNWEKPGEIPQEQKKPVVLLKDIVISNLPSPYYHFEYNADSSFSSVSFASGFRRYRVDYVGGRINEMVDSASGALPGLQEKVQYFYDNSGRVSTVRYLDLAGEVYIKVFFTYAGQKLIRLERQRRIGSDFVVNKTLSFSYYSDGNLKEIIDHRPYVDGHQQESTTTDWFGEYDSKMNVDGFSLLHNDFFDHLLLPSNIQLQKNNPAKEVVRFETGAYEANYGYTYDNKNRPLTKDGDVSITTSSAADQRFHTTSTYSYY